MKREIIKELKDIVLDRSHRTDDRIKAAQLLKELGVLSNTPTPKGTAKNLETFKICNRMVAVLNFGSTESDPLAQIYYIAVQGYDFITAISDDIWNSPSTDREAILESMVESATEHNEKKRVSMLNVGRFLSMPIEDLNKELVRYSNIIVGKSKSTLTIDHVLDMIEAVISVIKTK